MTKDIIANSYGIRDNHTRDKVADFLVEKIAIGSQLAAVSAYFTIYTCESHQAGLWRALARSVRTRLEDS